MNAPLAHPTPTPAAPPSAKGATRVYRFGLGAPIEGADLVHEQLRLAHTYRRYLTAVEVGRRGALRAVMTEAGLGPFEAAVREAEAAVEAARVAVCKARGAARSKKKVDPALAQALTAANAQRRAARGALSEARGALRAGESVLAAQRRIDAMAKEAHHNGRAHCGVYWGSYLLLEDDMDAAAEAPLYDNAEPNDPRVPPWRGEGRLGVQVQNGMDAADLFSGESRLVRVDPVDERAWLPTSHGGRRAERRRYCRTRLHLRVDSDPKGHPLWAVFPMAMHREIPKGARVKRVTVSLTKVGPVDEWAVTMTVTLPPGWHTEPCGHGTVALDVGWRQVQGGLRAAVWKGEDGRGGEVLLSDHPTRPRGLGLPRHGLVGRLRQPDELRSQRDLAFNEVREAVAKARDAGTLPEWLTEATATLRAWRGFHRLVRLTNGWSTQVFGADTAARTAWLEACQAAWASQDAVQACLARGGEAEALGTLEQARDARVAEAAAMPYPEAWEGGRALHELVEAWRFRDHRRWAQESSLRASALRRRREEYRVFAAQLARQYETLVIEEFDLRPLVRKAAVTSEETDVAAVRSQRAMAAVSELRMACVQAFQARGGFIEKVPAAYTTQDCAKCGAREVWDAAREKDHTCTKCGARWDQDDNACDNFLDAARRRAEGEALPSAPKTARKARPAKAPDPNAVPGETRWAKARRLGDEKKRKAALAAQELDARVPSSEDAPTS